MADYLTTHKFPARRYEEGGSVRSQAFVFLLRVIFLPSSTRAIRARSARAAEKWARKNLKIELSPADPRPPCVLARISHVYPLISLSLRSRRTKDKIEGLWTEHSLFCSMLVIN